MLQEDIITHTYSGAEPGKNLVVFGSVHGNEPCGPQAISLVRNAIETGELNITRGTVTFVPICNPVAHAENRRFVEQDLNRIFKKHVEPASYEARLANTLTGLIDACDVFLDIHSATAAGPISVFVDFPTQANHKLAASLGAEYALLNWPELYESNEFFDSFDTTRYAFEAGKDGVLIECGQHNDPEAIAVARDSILRTLAHLDMVAPKDAPEITLDAPMHSIKLVRLERREALEDTLTEHWEHLQHIPAGTVVATRASGEKLIATNDSLMLLPKYAAQPGGEWFYLGEEVSQQGSVAPIA